MLRNDRSDDAPATYATPGEPPMYPIAPALPLSGDLVRTGIPLAGLLVATTILLVLGLLALRGSALARERTAVAA
ncbi:MAG: hypothetical protein R2702_18895 [Acidimicrobiales bacterium]